MSPSGQYHDLGIFSDWVDVAVAQQPLFPIAAPGLATQQRVREVLGFCGGEENPLEVRIDDQWEKDGLIGEAISWSVGYGPRTEAWLLKPASVDGPLPAVVALYEHGGFKYLGKEKIAIGPDEPPPFLQNWWDKYYGGRPFANALAQAGFAVLIHDTFLWGSRRFPQEVMPDWAEKALAGMADSNWLSLDIPYEIGLYNFSASLHENQIEKLCRVLGTTLAGMVSHEDRIAVNYLQSRADIGPIGCVGLSGGGARAALLQATHPNIQATVVVSMMASYVKMLDRDVTRHTWMLYPSGWSKFGDWPDLAACRAPSPLLVQYNSQDELFALEAMQAGHERLTEHYQNIGQVNAYRGEFYAGGHKFDLEMQDSAFAWLARQLKSARER